MEQVTFHCPNNTVVSRVQRMLGALAGINRTPEGGKHYMLPSSRDGPTLSADVLLCNAEQQRTTECTFDCYHYYSRLNGMLDNGAGDFPFGRLVAHSPSLSSTQSPFLEATQCASFGSELVVVADEQRLGRGRGQNTWESPRGSLCFSFPCFQRQSALLPHIQYLVSLAVVTAVDNAPGCGDLGLRIKWPNDIYANMNAVGASSGVDPPSWVKVGGVLCQASARDAANGFDVVVGVGLNVNNSKPTICLSDLMQRMHSKNSPVDVGDEAGHGYRQGLAAALTDHGTVRREDVLASFFHRFSAMYSQFDKEGFAPFVDAYTNRWLHRGQSVLVRPQHAGNPQGDGEHDDGSLERMTIMGIDANTAQLLANDTAGVQWALHPDQNSLDLLQGLIKSKPT